MSKVLQHRNLPAQADPEHNRQGPRVQESRPRAVHTGDSLAVHLDFGEKITWQYIFDEISSQYIY